MYKYFSSHLVVMLLCHRTCVFVCVVRVYECAKLLFTLFPSFILSAFIIVEDNNNELGGRHIYATATKFLFCFALVWHSAFFLSSFVCSWVEVEHLNRKIAPHVWQSLLCDFYIILRYIVVLDNIYFSFSMGFSDLFSCVFLYEY